MNARLAGAITVGLAGCVLAAPGQTRKDTATPTTLAGAHPAVTLTRFFTGADRRTHAQSSQLQFGPDNVAKLPATAAEFHWMLQGHSAAPQASEQRMYIVTLSGTGENALIDGKKFPIGPGTVDVMEDTTGQGHYTNNNEDRLTVWLKLADTSPAAQDAAAKASVALGAAGAMSKAFKPVTLTRIFNGPDGLGHAEEVEAPVTQDGVLKADVTGAELHWQLPSANADWHRGPRHQYVITLVGRGEVEVSGGKKIPVGPGSIDLIDDTAGKGHITRNFTPRLTLWLPFVDQSDK